MVQHTNCGVVVPSYGSSSSRRSVLTLEQEKESDGSESRKEFGHPTSLIPTPDLTLLRRERTDLLFFSSTGQRNSHI